MVLLVTNLPANTGDARAAGSIPGSRRSPGEGHGPPLQSPCLENPVGRGAWQAIGQEAAEMDTTEQLTTQTHTYVCVRLWDHMDSNQPGSSVHGIFQARRLKWVPFPSPGDLSDPGIEPTSVAFLY